MLVRSPKIAQLAVGKVEPRPSLLTPVAPTLHYSKGESQGMKVLPGDPDTGREHRVLPATASQGRASLVLEK